MEADNRNNGNTREPQNHVSHFRLLRFYAAV